jgi:hypothetical protein
VIFASDVGSFSWSDIGVLFIVGVLACLVAVKLR